MRYTTIFLLLLFTTSLFSAETSKMQILGNGQKVDNEFVDKKKLDSNMELCAGLQIETDLVGLSFESDNGIVSKDEKPGFYILYLSADERKVTVLCSGFEPLHIILRNYGIGLEKGGFYKIKITGDKKVGDIPVNIITTPAGATLIVDGVDYGAVSMAKLKSGKHKIVLAKEGFKTIEENIEISQDKNLFNYNLTEIEVLPVLIKSEPTEAEIIVNNQAKGVTNKNLFLFPGTYQLELKKNGYISQLHNVSVVENKENLFNYSLIKNVSYLDIDIKPSDAVFKLNELAYKPGKLELIPGLYEIEISRSGYLSQKEKIELKLGATVSKSFNLTKNIGTLNIEIQPADAKVLINKEVYNAKNIELGPGTYKLEVIKDNYYPVSENFEIKLGQQLTKQFALKAKAGKLQFSIQPLEAEVKLTQTGQNPIEWSGVKILKDLLIGDYELECKANGYKSYKKTISITESQTAVEDISMEKGVDVPEIKGFIFVEGGTFSMGSNERDDEKPIHSVTVSDFYIAEYEVTQNEWQAVMGSNPSKFKGDDLPVETVSWDDCQEYIRKLNAKTGKKYRLPTEAEWEYAGKGGKTSAQYEYSGNNNIDEVAWYSDNSVSKTHPVGQKQANELGIYDMTGNVWEWCSDWYADKYYGSSPSINPHGASSGSYRVNRGGSWGNNATSCRVDNRDYGNPAYGNRNLGLRLVLSP